MSAAVLNRAKDIKAKYMVMGNWCSAKLDKKNRGSRTGSKSGRVYVAVPPETGWPGGQPENNGLRGRSSK